MKASVAVLDVGKTNVKLSAVTPDGAVAETLAVANEVRPGPPWRHHDLRALGDWALGALAKLARRHPLERVVATGHGSGGMLVGEDPDAGGDGCALPMIDYEQPAPPDLDEAYAAMCGSFADRGSVVMAGATHQARQLLWMERAFPEAVAQARWHLGVPQYWAWRLSGAAVSEPSFLGAQSHLWNVPEGRWAPVVDARGWRRLLPPFARAWDDLGPVRPELAARHGLPAGLRVHAGAHDSTANAFRYRAAGRGDLLVVSTGTWIVGLAGGVPVERLDERAGMTINADLDGRPVGGALTMGGRAFAALAGEQDGRGADLGDVSRLVGRDTMALPTFGSHDGQFPGTAGQGRILGPPPEGAEERLALAVLHVALLTAALIDRLDPERPVVLDGTFLREPLFAALVAALRGGRETWVSDEPYGIAAGAALLTGHAGRTAPAPVLLRRPAPAKVPGLLPYARRWAELAPASSTERPLA